MTCFADDVKHQGLKRLATMMVLLTALQGCGDVDAPVETNPLVRTVDTGRLIGGETPEGAYRWAGIPYAKAPVGKGRWQPPALPLQWGGVRDATSVGAPCLQQGGGGTLMGSEDCLFLNVFAAPLSVAALATSDPRPVLFWIHGGGNSSGDGSSYNGTNLAMRKNLVVVSINYRLGPMGWFHHPAVVSNLEAGAPKSGHFAVLDMIAALNWVQRNIGQFGGNPDRVTLIGESSGAQDVVSLMMTPFARGLFQGVIAESGGLWNMTLEQALNYTDDAVPGTPASAREIVAELLIRGGRATDRSSAKALQASLSGAELDTWLRSLDASEIMAPYGDQPNLGYDLPNIVYDGVMFAKEGQKWIFSDPERYSAVPLMLGANKDEQKYFTWNSPYFVEIADDGSRTIRDEERYEAYNRYYSVWWNDLAVNDVADDIVSAGHSLVYGYRFDWDEEPSGPDGDYAKLIGSAHAIEMSFITGDFSASFFGGKAFTEENQPGRQILSDIMMNYVADFARRGGPNVGFPGEGGAPHWRAWRVGDANKLIFDTEAGGGIRMENDPTDLVGILGEVMANPALSHDEKCRIYRDLTMYPSYPVAALAELGCR